MLSKLHSRLGTAGFIVAIVALIAAVAGTAFAATGLNSKQKKEVKSIAKSVAGAPGAAGPAGPAGPKGADGAQGAAGKDGASVTTGAVTPVECPAGGVKVIPSAGAPIKICNGKNGAAGTSGVTETLPPEETETGAWSLTAPPSLINYQFRVPFSFSIPLAEKLPPANLHWVNPAGKEIIANLVTEEIEEVDPTNCSGDSGEPEADAGHLCIYTTQLLNANSANFNFVDLESGGSSGTASAAVSGAILAFDVEGDEFGTKVPKAFGSWAVTACPEAGCTP